MKITCDSCGSKYTIADAKVKGRKVKVRCKGCKESILVDGTQLDGTEAEDADGADDSDNDDSGTSTSDAAVSKSAAAGETPKKDKNLWSVNLTDDDSRDMTIDELIAGWKSGLVTSDAYVWKDGMGDWKPILEVGELKLKLGPSPTKARSGVVSSTAKVAAPAAAKTNDKLDDLFGGVDFAGHEPSEPEKPTAGFGGEAKPTGARNDSSVLFSLDSLNTGSDAGTKQKADAVDLFGNLGSGGAMLTNNADLLTAPAKAPPAAPAGARVVPGVEAAPAKGKGGIILAILGAAVIIGGVLFFTMGGSGDGAVAEDPTALAAKEAEAKKAEDERKKAEDERAKLASELKKMQDELKKARDDATEKGEDPEEAAAKKQAELDKEKAEAEATATAEKSTGSSTSSTSSKSDSGSSKPAPAPEPKPASGGAAFDVGAAKAALAAAAANAAACKQPTGPTGPGKVQVTFSTSGRVTSATVITGPFGGTAVGGCIASTFRRARVPAFSGDAQTVAKSFTIP